MILCLKKIKLIQKKLKKILVDLINNGKTIAEVSREYGVATFNLVGWKKLYTNISPESEELITLAEYKKLKKDFLSIAIKLTKKDLNFFREI